LGYFITLNPLFFICQKLIIVAKVGVHNGRFGALVFLNLFYGSLWFRQNCIMFIHYQKQRQNKIKTNRYFWRFRLVNINSSTAYYVSNRANLKNSP